MKNSSLLFITLIIGLFSSATLAQDNAVRLIVRGDDMGFSHAGNRGLIKSYLEGIERSIEVIVPSPWYPEAIKLLEENPKIDVGIHLALTSEWDLVKYRPLSSAESIRDANGYFFPFIWPNSRYPKASLEEQQWQLEDIEREFRAQIENALQNIKNVSHISGHMGCYSFNEEVNTMTQRLAKEYGLDIDPKKYGVKSVSYMGPKKTPKQKIKAFKKMLSSLEKGNTYLFVDHPAINSEELRAVYHLGYEDVAADRQGVVEAWTSPKIKRYIEKQRIKLISYADLVGESEEL